MSIRHIKRLAEIDACVSLKMAPYLKEDHLDPNHCGKMGVASALALLNHDVAAAIRTLVHVGNMAEEALTTAWFLELIFKWFKLMTSRTRSLAMSELSIAKHEEAIAFLEEVVTLFGKITIQKPGECSSWKPVQTGVLLATQSALQLQEVYLKNYGFNFFFLSRLSQDALENFFSVVRQKHPIPRALEFKVALRLITLSTFFTPVSSGNYEINDCNYLNELLAKQSSKPVEERPGNIWDVDECFFTSIDSTELQSLHYLSGYVVQAVLKRHKLCKNCEVVLTDSMPSSQHAILTKNKEYKREKSALCLPSQTVFDLLQKTESCFQSNEKKLVAGKLDLQHVTNAVLFSFDGGFPKLLNVPEKLVSFFSFGKAQVCIEESHRLYCSWQC